MRVHVGTGMDSPARTEYRQRAGVVSAITQLGVEVMAVHVTLGRLGYSRSATAPLLQYLGPNRDFGAPLRGHSRLSRRTSAAAAYAI